jgi:menaquinone-dependent protoporphyrinogen oxidase
MSTKVLVGYATRYGSTQEVAELIATVLREGDFQVDLQPLRAVWSLTGYQTVVLGAPLFMFHWHPDAMRFLSRHAKALAELRAQLDKELAKFPWLKPVAMEMFGGKYDPSKLRFPIKMLAGTTQASELRDWEVIREWAESLKTMLIGLIPEK